VKYTKKERRQKMNFTMKELNELATSLATRKVELTKFLDQGIKGKGAEEVNARIDFVDETLRKVFIQIIKLELEEGAN
jgi:uncharacterized surface anchored protein